MILTFFPFRVFFYNNNYNIYNIIRLKYFLCI